MSTKSRAGRTAWAARAATHRPDLTNGIVADSMARMDGWIAHGRIPARTRIMARVAGRPLRLPAGEARR
jgi:hypothetical protein